jgi:DNA transformation protein and related proteins
VSRRDSFRDFVCETLEALPAFVCKPMFGGFGLCAGGEFFGLIHRQRLFLRTDDETRSRYVAAGMGFFQPNEKQALRRYFEVPADVLEDSQVLLKRAQEALAAK